MISTKHVFALAAAIAVAGVVTVEITRSTAQADNEHHVMTYTQAYSAARVDTAFDLVSSLPEAQPFTLPMAMKGDLPVPAGCEGAFEAECMDVAYELPSDPAVVVETRSANSSMLTRFEPITVASLPAQ